MTDELVWTTIRDEASASFDGELPTSETEETLIRHFQQRPRIVLAVLEEVAARKRDGKIRSAWAIARKQLEALNTNDVTVSPDTDLDKHIRNAKAWIRNVGYQYTQQAVEDELFGPSGRFHSNDPTARSTLMAYWHTRRDDQ